MKILLFCDSFVGEAIANYLFQEHPNDIGAVITIAENNLYSSAIERDIPAFVFESESQLLNSISTSPIYDFGVLAWWPKLISQRIIALTKSGFINTHPSLLPHNRGKHYNFWTLVDQTPFGVTLHFVDEGIDTGDIIAQKEIPYCWEDTGETLYKKARSEMVNLFKGAYPKIRSGNYKKIPQNPKVGSLHYAKDIDLKSLIDLDKQYTARDLLNLLRARTFTGYPSCQFKDDLNIYDVTVTIKKRT